jgi:hypothetical protein
MCCKAINVVKLCALVAENSEEDSETDDLDKRHAGPLSWIETQIIES